MSTLTDRTHVEKDRKYHEILSQKPCMGTKCNYRFELRKTHAWKEYTRYMNR